MSRANARSSDEEVSTNNFTVKLKKELLRSPKKSAALALISVVAIWFWVPLVWGWIAPSSNGATATESVSAADSTTPTSIVQPAAAQPVATAQQASSELNWKNLADLFQNHRLMQTAQLRREAAAPFGKAKPEANDEVANEENAVEGAAEEGNSQVTAVIPEPAELGLLLSSTIVGGDIRLAMINGETCTVGEILVIPQGQREIEFEIIKIQKDAVLLLNGTDVKKLERMSARSAVVVSSNTESRTPPQHENKTRKVIHPHRHD